MGRLVGARPNNFPSKKCLADYSWRVFVFLMVTGSIPLHYTALRTIGIARHIPTVIIYI